jgi:hypothetical protein
MVIFYSYVSLPEGKPIAFNAHTMIFEKDVEVILSYVHCFCDRFYMKHIAVSISRNIPKMIQNEE